MESIMAQLFPSTVTPFGEITLRLGLACVLASVIGLEREASNKAAGLRTHMLVSLAAATFAILTIELAHDAAWLGENIRQDPLRVVEAVVTGIAFLGAGAIIRSGGTVYGVTTGASIWLAGSVGLACGIGRFDIALLLVLLSLVILSLLLVLERWIVGRRQRSTGSRASVEDAHDKEGSAA